MSASSPLLVEVTLSISSNLEMLIPTFLRERVHPHLSRNGGGRPKSLQRWMWSSSSLLGWRCSSWVCHLGPVLERRCSSSSLLRKGAILTPPEIEVAIPNPPSRWQWHSNLFKRGIDHPIPLRKEASLLSSSEIKVAIPSFLK